MQASCCAEKKNREEKAYKIYVTSALENMNRILAEAYTGSYMSVSYKDMISGKVETRTAEEIKDGIRRKLEGLQ